MYSIGIDIGTSTTEVIISELKISTKPGPSLLPVTEIEKKSVVYRSRIIFTPFLTADCIDFSKIKKSLRKQ